MSPQRGRLKVGGFSAQSELKGDPILFQSCSPILFPFASETMKQSARIGIPLDGMTTLARFGKRSMPTDTSFSDSVS